MFIYLLRPFCSLVFMMPSSVLALKVTLQQSFYYLAPAHSEVMGTWLQIAFVHACESKQMNKLPGLESTHYGIWHARQCLLLFLVYHEYNLKNTKRENKPAQDPQHNLPQDYFSWLIFAHSITEELWVSKGDPWRSCNPAPLLRAGSDRVTCWGTCSVRFWASPRMKTPQSL